MLIVDDDTRQPEKMTNTEIFRQMALVRKQRVRR
jgi:hypothetical protein